MANHQNRPHHESRPIVRASPLSPRSRLGNCGGRLPWAYAHGYLLPPAPRAESIPDRHFRERRIAKRPRSAGWEIGECTRKIMFQTGRAADQGRSSDPSPRRGRQRVASGEEASETRRNPRYRRHQQRGRAKRAPSQRASAEATSFRGFHHGVPP
jgi:hypothetical protein